MNYTIYVCPLCREQVVGDDVGLGYAVHEHDGVGYVPVPIQLSPDRLPPIDDMLAAQCARDEERHRLAEERRVADAAELAEMERAWRASAAAEQVQAYDRASAVNHKTLVSVSRALKDVYSGPEFLREWDASGRVSSSLFFGDTDSRRAAENELQRVRRENAEETLRRFDEEGPAAVPFWKLRDARRKLAELT
jgi:hypothetical protein